MSYSLWLLNTIVNSSIACSTYVPMTFLYNLMIYGVAKNHFCAIHVHVDNRSFYFFIENKSDIDRLSNLIRVNL